MDNARKRQRRQTAGSLMQNIFGVGGGKGKNKKSTAQPRPMIRIPPRGVGPIYTPNPNDVLSGRGGRINAHPGNVHFRDVVQARKKEYLDKDTKKLEKAHIAAEIVRKIRELDPPGRFLKEDADGSWWDIGDAKAIKKVGQALREDAPDIRGHSSGSEGDDFDNDVAPEVPSDAAAAAAAAAAPVTDKKTPSLVAEPSSAAVVKSAVTVSNRGAKVKSGAQQVSSPESQPYQPIVYQEIAPPPSYQVVVPVATGSQSQTAPFHPSLGLRGLAHKGGTAVSGAAAAVMKQHQIQEEELHYQNAGSGDFAFGRAFHPHPIFESHGESSLVSGLSGPSMMSGVSAISGLSDPMSSLSAGDSSLRRSRPGTSTFQAMRMNQLQQLRQQWAAQHQGGDLRGSDNTATRTLLGSGNAGLGGSLIRSLSLTDVQAALDNQSMSLASYTEGHSLFGGGIRDDSMIGGSMAGGSMHGGASLMMGGSMLGDGSMLAGSLMSGQSHGNHTVAMRDTRDGTGTGTTSVSSRQSGKTRSSSNTQRVGQHPYHTDAHQHQHHHNSSTDASVTSMSIHSESLASATGSIMSDLSENLIALDLADNKLLDQL